MWRIDNSPADTGHAGVSRPRVYVLMCHKETGVVLADPVLLYQNIANKIGIYVRSRPRDYFVSSSREVELEAMSLASARGIAYRPVAWICCVDSAPRMCSEGHSNLVILQSAAEACGDLSYMLTPREVQAVGVFSYQYSLKFGRAAHLDEDLIVFLGDNPSFMLTWSASSNKIPCFRNNRGLFWIPSLTRWLTTQERLLCLGLPVYEDYAAALSVPMLPCRDLHRSASLIGNSMHLPSVAVVELVVLSCFGKSGRV